MNDKYSFALQTAFIPGVLPGETLSNPVFWFIFTGEELLVEIFGDDSLSVCSSSPEDLGFVASFSQYLGRYGSTDCFVVELPDTIHLPPSIQPRKLRSLFGKMDDDLFTLAGRAMQVMHYHREHQFCGKCGTRMVNRETELAKICPECSFISFPRLSPAVIMSVIRGEEILLARAPRFPTGVYSTLAGFVEPGETLEEAVAREIREEVDIVVNNIRYVASQPWPFPHSIMIGFTADYESGEITVDGNEIEDAGWFSIDNLPQLPSKITIARLLIDNFINSCS
ncbi:MAG: NAD(+) diphosphatase [Desulforhopalus sp.]